MFARAFPGFTIFAVSEASGDRDPVSEARKWLRTQGYVLEYEAAAAFRQAGFQAWQGRTYRDGDASKPRDIDVVARASLTRSALALYAVVECKHAATPWIVRQTFIGGQDLTWQPIATPGVGRALAPKLWILASALPFPIGDVGFAAVQAEKGPDVAFGALAQAVSAARATMRDAEFRHSALALPVVMIDKPIVTLSYDANGAETLQAVDWTRILWSGIDTPTAVDIATREAFPKYAEKLRAELGSLAESIENNGPFDFRDPPAITTY